MKRIKRLFYSVILFMLPKSSSRIKFIKKHGLYGFIGENVHIQKKKLPLYSNLIYIHNNVKIASNVGFITHDIIHKMLNDRANNGYIERIGCIEIMDNVFIGSGTRIMYNTRIGSNVIIGSGSIVTKDIPDNSVYAGVPAKYICSFDEYEAKARDYSNMMKDRYGVSRLTGVNDELARKMYADFVKAREK